jgi:segregation and condensation protein B
MVDTPLASRIEALLFSEGGPLALTKLAKLLGVSDADIRTALDELDARLTGGLSLIHTDTEAALAVSQDTAGTIEDALTREEREIGDAGLEVLAILLYRGPSTRATIDYIRGVNSSFSIRTLLTRGLVERTHNPDDTREYLYRPTVELMAHLGTKNSAELPEYATITAELAAFEASHAPTGDQTGDTASDA